MKHSKPSKSDLLEIETNTIVFLIGASGSGKTVVGRRVTAIKGWRLSDSDEEIARRTGTTIDHIFESHGEAHFRKLEEHYISNLRGETGVTIVATGGGLPTIPGMIGRLNTVGTTVHLRADVDMLWKRLTVESSQLADRPLLKEGGKGMLARMIQRREYIYNQAAITLDTNRRSIDEVCAVLCGHVESILGGAEISYKSQRACAFD